MDIDKLKQEYTDNLNKFPGICCIDVLGLIRELEHYKRALKVGAKSFLNDSFDNLISVDDICYDWLEEATKED